MRTARINYVGASDIEYTEIRPIRPNQSVVLAGLGVTGSRLQAATKDRRYRSTQGAGYSDGLVIHSRPATRPDTGGGDWHDPPPASRGGDTGLPRAGAEAGLAAVFPRYDLRQPRIVFEDEVFVPVTAGSGATPRLRSSSVSPVRSPQQPLPASTPGTNKRSVATTYDLCFEQHLQNLAHLDPDPGPSRLSFSTRSTTPVTARYREAACQTPTELNMRLSPMIAASAASLASEAQTNISVPKIIEDCLQEETEEKDDQKHELDEVTDDELDLIGDYMVRESLDVAASDLDSTIKVQTTDRLSLYVSIEQTWLQLMLIVLEFCGLKNISYQNCILVLTSPPFPLTCTCYSVTVPCVSVAGFHGFERGVERL